MIDKTFVDKHYKNSQLIQAKEQQLDDYEHEKTNLLQAVEHYQEIMAASFSNLDTLNQNLIACGSCPARLDMDANQEISRAVKTMTEEQKEEISEIYTRVRQRLEDEVDQAQHDYHI